MKLKDVILDDRNANKGTARGQKQIVGSIQRNGFGRSGLLDKNGKAIAGNKTTEAAAEVFGVEVEPIIVQTDGKRPVYVQRTDLDLDDPDPNNAARRLAYEDNLASSFSFSLDPDIVMADIEAGFDFEAIDITLPDLGEMLEGAARELLRGNGNGQPPEDSPPIDKAAELQEKWQVKPGDIWQIDRHFIICGDCREPETWQRLLDAAGVDRVNGVFTSPPYAEQRKAQYGGVPTSEYVEWWGAVQTNVRAALAEDGSFFVNIKPHCEDGQRVLYVFDLVLAMVRVWGWRFVDELEWLHEDLPGAWPNRFRNGFEPVFHFAVSAGIKFLPKSVAKPSDSVPHGIGGLQRRDGGNWTLDAPLISGMAQPSNVLKIGGNTDGQSHAAAFPVALPTFFIKAYSDPGDVWLDPFLGSGTTIAAAHNEGRIGTGIERLEKYVSVCLERLMTLTGQTPKLLTELTL